MLEPKKAARQLISGAINYMLPHTPGIIGEIPVYYYTDWARHANEAMREIMSEMKDKDGESYDWYFNAVDDSIGDFYDSWLVERSKTSEYIKRVSNEVD